MFLWKVWCPLHFRRKNFSRKIDIIFYKNKASITVSAEMNPVSSKKRFCRTQITIFLQKIRRMRGSTKKKIKLWHRIITYRKSSPPFCFLHSNSKHIPELSIKFHHFRQWKQNGALSCGKFPPGGAGSYRHAQWEGGQWGGTCRQLLTHHWSIPGKLRHIPVARHAGAIWWTTSAVTRGGGATEVVVEGAVVVVVAIPCGLPHWLWGWW